MDQVPKEILIYILQSLPFDDLKRSLLVSKRFMDAGLEACLWKSFQLIVSKRNIGKLEKILELERMKNIKTVIFKGCKIKSKQLKLISQTKVKQIQIGDGHDIENDCIISEVTPSTLALLIGKMETFKFHNSLLAEMNPKQIRCLANQLKESTSLKKLEIFYNNNLTSLPPEILASALCSLTELTLVFQKLNPDKYNAIFSQINQCSNLKVLNLPGNNLSNVNPEIFGTAVRKLEKVNLSDTRLTPAMFYMLLSKMKKDSELQELDVSHNPSLKYIDDHIFSDAINTLEKVNLKFTNTTVSQLTHLFELMKLQTRLKDMNLVGNHSLANASEILLAGTVNKLIKVTIYATKLSRSQIQAILSHIEDKDSNLKALDLGGNNLSSIPSRLIASSINKLENATLYCSQLSINQQVEILLEALKDTKLKYLDLGGNQGRLPEELLKEVKKKIVLRLGP